MPGSDSRLYLTADNPDAISSAGRGFQHNIPISRIGHWNAGGKTPVAFSVERVVNHVTKTLDACNNAYSRIYKEAQKRELLGIEIKRKRLLLAREEIDFIENSADRMAKMMDLKDATAINARTNDPLISLKILLSLYRRVCTLATYQIRGKAEFGNSKLAANHEASEDEAWLSLEDERFLKPSGGGGDNHRRSCTSSHRPYRLEEMVSDRR